jgi:putative oxidoreductase
MGLGRLAARVVIGAYMFGHGTQKLFGWFDGHGLEATSEQFGKLGLVPGRRNAIAAGVAESGGGVLLAAGLATPLAAAALTGTMLTAVHRVHLAKGPWLSKGGYEYNLVLISAVLAIAEAGPGPLSLDALGASPRKGRACAVGVLGAGALGAFAVDRLARANAISELAPTPGEVPQPTQQAGGREPAVEE